MGKRTIKPAGRAVETPPGFVNWREFDPSWLPDGDRSTFATELCTYRDHLDEMLEHKGRFVAIRESTILGYYRTRQAAIAAAFERYGAVPVLIKQVVELEPVRRLGGVIL